MLVGLAEPVHLRGGSGCSDRCSEGSAVVTDDVPVMGQLSTHLPERAGVWVFAQCLGDRRMEQAALPRKQFAIDRLLQQDMPEPVRVMVDDEQLSFTELAAKLDALIRPYVAATRDALAVRGHDVSEGPEWDWRAGAVCAIVVGPVYGLPGRAPGTAPTRMHAAVRSLSGV